LPNLTEVDANSNQLKEIPVSLCSLNPKLRILNLRKNRILTLPSYIKDLQSLEILNLGANPISSPIPEEIATIPKLSSLLLDTSNITTLPKMLGTMKTLTRVDLGTRVDMNDAGTKVVLAHLKEICKKNNGWLKPNV
jgi:Leucine-rich repeat (LRR) protein